MLLSQIEYGMGGYTKEKIWCPRFTPNECGSVCRRGAWAQLPLHRSESYVNPEECRGCEYKMYRTIGCTCPDKAPAHRKKG
jgi:MinD superfamily P-loop ATPase